MLWAASTRPSSAPAAASASGAERPCSAANREPSSSVSARWVWKRASELPGRRGDVGEPGSGTV